MTKRKVKLPQVVGRGGEVNDEPKPDESLPDPDEGLELRQEVKDRLKQSSRLPHGSLLSIDEIRKQIMS